MERVNPSSMPKTETAERLSSTGKLIVITGRSGSGKDTVIDTLLSENPQFRRLITCADRQPREGELEGVHYYFVSAAELDRMHQQGELVEEPLHFGTSRKATPKKEFSKILHDGNQLIWRIDMSLAIQVVTGDFFDKQFTSEESKVLKKITEVIFINASQHTIDRRRKERDKGNYNPDEYLQRDQAELAILEACHSNISHIIPNEDGKLDETLDAVIKVIDSIL